MINSEINRLNQTCLTFFWFPFSQILLLHKLYKTSFPSSCKISSLPRPELNVLHFVLLSFPLRINLVPSPLKYRKSTAWFAVNEVHMARPPQVRTKLPFFRKWNWYIWFLDWRYFPLLKIAFRRHLSSKQFSRNKHKFKALESEAPRAFLIWEKHTE